MREMMSVQDLAREITRVNDVKKDFIVNSNALESVRRNEIVGFDLDTFYPINNLAHSQLSNKLGIPKKYYDKMLQEQPDLLINNINTWMKYEPKKNLMRTLDGNIRAILSDKYALYMDNSLVLTSILPVLMDYPDMQYKSVALTEQRMYIQAVLPSLEREVKVGEPVQAGIVISNSEVGVGRFTIEKMIYILSCTNGQIRGQSIGKTHISRKLDETNFLDYQNDTIRAENDAFKLMVRDQVRDAFNMVSFDEDIKQVQKTTTRKIGDGNVEKVIVDVSKKYDIIDRERNMILQRFIEGGDLSQWGVSQAVTNVANTTANYDRVIELERIGGEIVNLSENEWYKMAN